MDVNQLCEKRWIQENPDPLISKCLIFISNDRAGVIDSKLGLMEITYSLSQGKLTVKTPSDIGETCDEYNLVLDKDVLVLSSDNVSAPLCGDWKWLEDDSSIPEATIDLGVPNYNTVTWMASVESSRSLKDMCIPGTHDSAAYQIEKSIASSWVITQDNSFRQQLMDGIRFFDLRLSENMNFFHDKFYLSQNIYSCMDVLTAFLNEHPSEAIIICVKPENCSDYNLFKKNFGNVINQYKKYFYLGEYVPTLAEARGKIVFMRRFDFNVGINMCGWKDDTTFIVSDTRGLHIQIQDRYSASVRDKCNYLHSDFMNAKQNHTMMYITYFSVTASVFRSIKSYASEIQSWFIDTRLWEDMKVRRYTGIYPFDFYNKTLIPFFIHTNYQSK